MASVDESEEASSASSSSDADSEDASNKGKRKQRDHEHARQQNRKRWKASREAAKAAADREPECDEKAGGSSAKRDPLSQYENEDKKHGNVIGSPVSVASAAVAAPAVAADAAAGGVPMPVIVQGQLPGSDWKRLHETMKTREEHSATKSDCECEFCFCFLCRYRPVKGARGTDSEFDKLAAGFKEDMAAYGMRDACEKMVAAYNESYRTHTEFVGPNQQDEVTHERPAWTVSSVYYHWMFCGANKDIRLAELEDNVTSMALIATHFDCVAVDLASGRPTLVTRSVAAVKTIAEILSKLRAKDK